MSARPRDPRDPVIELQNMRAEGSAPRNLYRSHNDLQTLAAHLDDTRAAVIATAAAYEKSAVEGFGDDGKTISAELAATAILLERCLVRVEQAFARTNGLFW